MSASDDRLQDERYPAAVRMVVAEQKSGISWLSRVMVIGYNRAARLLEQMEIDEIVSPPDRYGVREVWATEVPDQFKGEKA